MMNRLIAPILLLQSFIKCSSFISSTYNLNQNHVMKKYNGNDFENKVDSHIHKPLTFESMVLDKKLPFTSSIFPTQLYASTSIKETKKMENKKKENQEKLLSDFCQGTNEFFKTKLVIKPVRDYVQIQPSGTSDTDILSKLKAPPEVPGISRPVWLTILGSVPTALGWYGYYKFSVEEELYQYELKTDGKVSGCGGFGTLLPFVYGILIGFPLSILPLPILHTVGDTIIQAAGLWILIGQVNLYNRVNELCSEYVDELDLTNGEPPLHSWWAILPPPLDVVVGLRQVHFLSEYWRIVRGDEYEKDIIAEELFPFISSPRFTLKEFFRTPSNWFWFTKDWKDFEYDVLKD